MGTDEGTHLSTCLVYAACVVAFVACVNADKFSVIYFILLKSDVHRQGQGTRLGACLVNAVCVMAFVACVNADKFSVMYLIFKIRLCMGMDEASALVRALYSSRVRCVL